MVKPRLYNKDDLTRDAALYTLKEVLIIALKLLHPYMPFITEEIFCTIQSEEESIMISKWPEYDEANNYADSEAEVELIKEAVRGIRNARKNLNVPNSKKAEVIVVSEKDFVKETFEKGKVFFATLGFASEVKIQSDKSGIGDDAVSVVTSDAVIYIPLDQLVDSEKEIARLKEEEKKLEAELERVNKMLANPNFVSKAPEKKIAEERAKKEKYEQMMEQVKMQLERMI